MAEKVHWKTAQKLAKEQSVEGSVDSIPDAPDAPVIREEYRVMSKRGDIAGYASSREEAQEKVKSVVGGYIVKV